MTDPGPDPAERPSGAATVPLAPVAAQSGKPVTLADTDEDLLVHGRIGYGTRTPWLLGGLLALVVLVLGAYSLLQGEDEAPAGAEPAPGFELLLFDGTTFRLDDHRGKVVVVNFWASWCEPCRDEMPVLQAAATRAGDDVVIVGVAAKNDSAAAAVAFANEFGVTYPVGQDVGGENRAMGPIQLSYNVIGFPATYVIDPEGNVSAIRMGPIEDPGELDALIAAARD